MTREQAIDRVRKLQSVTVERGATAHEAAVARDRARRLIERFGLDGRGPVRCSRPAVAGYAAAARTDRRSSRSLRFVAFG